MNITTLRCECGRKLKVKFGEGQIEVMSIEQPKNEEILKDIRWL